ncbi:hypothetical protein D3C86_1989600 [compost metagenome]
MEDCAATAILPHAVSAGAEKPGNLLYRWKRGAASSLDEGRGGVFAAAAVQRRCGSPGYAD